MGFAAGAMIFVVVEELIQDSQTNGNTDQWQHRRGNPGAYGRLCHYDDPRRRFGINEITLYHRCKVTFLYKHDKIRVMTT